MRSQHILKIAVVGSGKIAAEYLKIFSQMPLVEVTGIYSRNLFKSKEYGTLYNVPYIATSMKDLFENSKSHFVIIAVSADQNFSVAIEALNYSWKILLEKPAGLSYEENQELINNLNSRNLFIGMNRRFYENIQILKKSMRKEYLPFLGICIDQEMPEIAKKFGHGVQVVKKWHYANSIHLIDLVLYLSRGEIYKIEKIYERRARNQKNVVAKITFTSGDTFIYFGIWNKDGPWKISLTLHNDYYELSPIESLVKIDKYGKKVLISDADNTYKPGFKNQINEMILEVNSGSSQLVNISCTEPAYRILREIYE